MSLGFFLNVIAMERAEVKDLKTLMIPRHVKGPLHSNHPRYDKVRTCPGVG